MVGGDVGMERRGREEREDGSIWVVVVMMFRRTSSLNELRGVEIIGSTPI